LRPTFPVIGITMGDPAGIGGEVTIKALKKLSSQLRCSPFIIGDASYLESLVRRLPLGVKIVTIDRIDRENLPFSSDMVAVLDLENLKTSRLEFGKCAPHHGKAAYEYIVKGIELASSGIIDALVTAPINKESLSKAHIHFSGHTEILTHFTQTTRFAMMLFGGVLRVVLVTRHIPLKDVSQELTEERVLTAIELAHEAGRYFDTPTPRIGVCGLNPHSGEGGTIGDEELRIIIPAIKRASQEGIDVTGPYPSDTLFYRVQEGEYDFIIAMYHDQGLIPLKTLYFEEGVNVTLGLPFTRTSPGHGTAYDIAGKGIAGSKSMEEAIKLAIRMTQKAT